MRNAIGVAGIYLYFAKTNFQLKLFRGWNDYENGFGNFVRSNGEYWLGNKNLNLLTMQGKFCVCIQEAGGLRLSPQC